MLDLGINETTTTTGTGTITTTAVTGYPRISQAFAVGDLVGYRIRSGNDIEWGIGTVGAGNTMDRTIIVKTYVAGTLTDGGTAITLAGTSDVVVTPHNATPLGDGGFVRTGLVQRWIPGAMGGTALTTLALTANRGYFVPFMPAFAEGSFASLGIEVTTLTAGTAYVAIFDSKLVSGNYRPGNRKYQTGALDTSTTGEKLTGSLGMRFKPGHLYWIAITGSSAATVRGIAVGGVNALLGFTNATTTARTHIYATQSGAFGTDASGLSYTIGTSTIPACLIAP